jgi:sensor histidine kinase YesM
MNNFLKELLRASLLGIIIFISTGIFQYLTGQRWERENILEHFWINQLVSVSLYMVNMFTIRIFIRHYKQSFWTVKVLVISILSGVVVSMTTLFLLRFFIIVVYHGVPFDQFLANEAVSEYYLSLFICVTALAIYYAFYYWKSKQETEVKQSRIIAGTASAKFDALKNQLDPHFLFNSLTVLTSLIDENPKQAQKFTTSLSKVYRYVLEQKNKELVSVDEELAFARTYMNLIKMRFEDSIVVDIPAMAQNPDAKVVPLSLQLLLENAVKHNMVTPSKKLHIRIFEEEGSLVVENNMQTKQVLKKSSGVGLQNIRQRYYLLTNRQVEIKEDTSHFRVSIPMLTTQQPMREVQETFIADKKYNMAKERVEKIKGFYVHFTIYCIMVPVFIWLNALSGNFPWAVFPILGWGLGILGHASDTFNWRGPILNKSWEERKINELMDDDKF